MPFKFKYMVETLLNKNSADYSLNKASPQFCVQLLNITKTKTFDKLLTKIKSCSKEWINEFIKSNGFFTLFFASEKICIQIGGEKTFVKSIMLTKCLKCMKEIMNLNVGMEFIISLATTEDKECIEILSKNCLTSNQLVKREIFQILSGIGIYSESGYTVCMRLLDLIKMKKSYNSPYLFLINELKTNLNIESGTYLSVILGFINCIISQPEELKERLTIKSQLEALKINEIVKQLKHLSNDDLMIQINLYEQVIKEDEQEALNSNGIIMTYFDCRKNEKLKEILDTIFQINDQDNETWNNLNDRIKEIVQNPRKTFKCSSTQTDKVEVKRPNYGQLLPPVLPPPEPPKIQKNFVNFPTDIKKETAPPLPPRRIAPTLPKPLATTTANLDFKIPTIPAPIPQTQLQKEAFEAEISKLKSELADLKQKYNALNEINKSNTIIKENESPKTISPPPPISVAPPPPPPPLPVFALPKVNYSTDKKSSNNFKVSGSVINVSPGPSGPPTSPVPLAPPITNFNAPPPPPITNFNAPPPPPITNFNAPPQPPIINFNAPPPPPILENFGKNSQTLVAKDESDFLMNSIPKPNLPLKSFNWQKVNNTYSKNSLWSEVNNKKTFSEIQVDYGKLEQLFSKSQIQKTEPNAKLLNVETAEICDQNVSFLDPKLTMGVVVFLKKIKTPIKDYLNLINDGKSKEIGIDNLSCLKKILPDKTDVDEIQAYCNEFNDINRLSKADQFIKLLSDIPCYELRINLMNFEEEFNELYSKLDIPFRNYMKCSEVLLNNKSLKLFLAMILAAGNFLNYSNNYAGKASGFKISILTKLNEVKTNNHSINMLHVLVEQFDSISKENKNNFLEELKDIGIILNSSYSNLNNDLNLLKKTLLDFTKQIKSEETSNDVRIQYSAKFSQFDSKVEQLNEKWKKIEEYKQNLIEYYCEDKLTFKLDDFLKIFNDFCKQFIQAREENKQRAINEERIVKRKKDLEEVEKRNPSVNLRDNSPKLENEGLKLLLSNLKKGRVQRQSVRKSSIYVE